MKNKDFLYKWLPVIWFALVAFIYVFLYVTKINYLLDADMSSEMLLADVLTKEHSLIMSKNWFYSTELRFLNNQLIFEFFLLFGHNYHLSRILSGITLMAIMLLSYHFLLKQMGLKKYYFITAPILMLPFSVIYSDIILVGLYYIPHISISFFSMGLIFAIQNASEIADRQARFVAKHKLITILMILSLFAGIGGPRQIIIFYLPLLLAALIIFYATKKFKYPAIYVAFFSSAVGYLINSKVLSKAYKYNDWSGFTYNGFSSATFDKILQGFLNVLGFTEGEIFSFATVRTGVAFVLLFLAVAYFIYFFRNLKTNKLPENEIITAVFLLSATFIYVLIYLFTDMFYEDRYTLPFIVFLLPLLAATLNNHNWIKPAKIIFSIGLSLMIFASSLCVYKAFWFEDKTAEHRDIVNYLMTNDYKNGYATYWNANLITELANGQIESYVWTSSIENIADVDDLYRWLQVKSHKDNPPTDKVFIVLSVQEYDDSILKRYIGPSQLVFFTSNYYVFGFENYEALITLMGSYHFDMTNAGYAGSAEITPDGWSIQNGQATTGPFTTLYRGSYTVTMSGTNLLNAEVNITYSSDDDDTVNTIDTSSVALMGENVTITDETNLASTEASAASNSAPDKPVLIRNLLSNDTIIYTINTNMNLHDFQISVGNSADSEILLKDMSIVRN